MSDNRDCTNNQANRTDNKSEKCISPIEACLFSLPPKQLAILSTVIGIALIDDLTVDQQNVLGNFLVSVGQTIFTAAAQQQLQESEESQDEIKDEIDNLKKQICLLKKELDSK